MVTIGETYNEAGKNISPTSDDSNAEALRDIADDLAALRAAFVTLTAKLDAEDVTNLDTDYAATCDPAALLTIKG